MTSLFLGDGLSVYYIFTGSPSSALFSIDVWLCLDGYYTTFKMHIFLYEEHSC